MENEARRIVRDFLNDEYTEKELMLKFDLEKCEQCDNAELKEDLHDTAYGKICENCLNDIDY